MSAIQNSVFGRVFFTGTGVIAVIAVLIGLFGLLAPIAALTIIGVIFGVYLTVAGLIRIFFAVRAKAAPQALRWVVGVLGGLVAAAGIFALIDRESGILALALVIGIGWIADGLGYFLSFASTRTETGSRRWEQLLLGAVFFAGGLAMIVLQNEGFAVLFWWISLLFLVVGAATIVWLIASASAIKKAVAEQRTSSSTEIVVTD